MFGFDRILQIRQPIFFHTLDASFLHAIGVEADEIKAFMKALDISPCRQKNISNFDLGRKHSDPWNCEKFEQIGPFFDPVDIADHVRRRGKRLGQFTRWLQNLSSR